jgi:uncharacterized protein DUF748
VRRRRIAIAFAAVLLVGAAYLVAMRIVGATIARALSEAAGTSARVGAVTWNPLAGRWTIRGVRVAAERGAPAFAARRIDAEIHVWDALRGRYRVRALTLATARLRLRATENGWELPFATPPGTSSTSAGVPVTLDWIAAPRAVVRLERRGGARTLLRMRVLELSGMLGPDGTRLQIWTRGRLDRGSLAFAGRLRSGPSRRRVRIRLAAEELDLARILRLASDTPVRDVRGLVSVHAKYDEAGRADDLSRRCTGSLGGRDLAFGARRSDALWIRSLDVSRFALDARSGVLALGRVSLRGGEAWIRHRDASEPAASPQADWTITAEGIAATDLLVHALRAESGEERGTLHVDEVKAGPLRGPEIAVPFSVAATVGSGGRLVVRGDVVPRPVGVTAHAEVSALALPPLAELAGLPVPLTSGVAAGAADVHFAEGKLDGAGSVTVSDVKTTSPDPANPENVIAFKEARLVIREARTDPPVAALERLDVEWPYVLVDRTADGIFPLSLVTGRASGGAIGALRVDRVHVLGGRIDFQDKTLTPPYWRALANLTLDAEGVQAPDFRLENLRGAGLIDEWSPLRVEGSIGSRTHLVAEVERLDLPPFNAYLAGAAPYTVSSGALNARSEITLDRSQLDVDNHVVLSRLGLAGGGGQDFAQRELGVPLTLALALMKDYRGNIELSLPFGGNLAQPAFEMRSVVMQAIIRAVRGAVLSPLNALGRALLRDGRIERIEVDPIPFAPGERVLDDAGRERATQVGRVLTTHPGLRARIHGLVAAADVERLEDEALLSRLADVADAEPLRSFLRARLEKRPPPSLGEGEAQRLEQLRKELPWPERAVHELARDRAAVATATLILEVRVEPERVSADTADVPRPESLAPAPGAGIELQER